MPGAGAEERRDPRPIHFRRGRKTGKIGHGHRDHPLPFDKLRAGVGAHYEVKNGSEITKYYLAGSTRIAMRKYQIPQPMTVEYMLSDHLGSTSLTADADGNKVLEIRYREASRAVLWRVDKACPLRSPAGVLREGEIRAT